MLKGFPHLLLVGVGLSPVFLKSHLRALMSAVTLDINHVQSGEVGTFTYRFKRLVSFSCHICNPNTL